MCRPGLPPSVASRRASSACFKPRSSSRACLRQASAGCHDHERRLHAGALPRTRSRGGRDPLRLAKRWPGLSASRSLQSMAEPLTRSRRMRWPQGACLLDICISPGVPLPSLTAAHVLCTSTTRTSPEAPAGSPASTLNVGSRPCLNAAETTPAQPAGPLACAPASLAKLGTSTVPTGSRRVPRRVYIRLYVMVWRGRACCSAPG